MPRGDRITFAPDIMGGRACIRGMRVTVSLIINLVASGMSTQEILEDYSCLESEDIRQALAYAAWLVEESVYPLELTGSEFLTDMGISPRTARLPREMGHEALRVRERGLGRLGQGVLSGPHGIGVDSQGSIYEGAIGEEPRIQKFVRVR